MSNTQQQYKSGFYVYFMIFVVSQGASYMYYALSMYNTCQTAVIEQFQIDDIEQQNKIKANITTIAIIGGLIGCILAPQLLQNKKTNARQIIIIIDLIGILASLGFIIANSISIIYLLRFIQGIVCGINSIIMPVLIKELSPLQILPITGVFNPLFMNLGAWFSIIVSLPVVIYNQYYFYKVVFAFPVIFLAVRLYGFLFLYKFDSPLRRIMQQDFQGARDIIQIIYKEEYTNSIFEEYEKEAQLKQKNKQSSYQEIFKPKYFKKTLMGCICMIMTQVSGQNIMQYYSNSIVLEITQNQTTTYIFVILFQLLSIVCILIQTTLSKKTGRRPLIVYGSIGVSFCMLLMAYQIYQARISNQVNYMVLVVMVIHRILIQGMSGSSCFGYITDILFDKSMTVSQIAYWFSNALIGYAFPFFEIETSFLFLGIIYGLLTLYVFFELEETKGLTRAEIEVLYNRKSINIQNNQLELQLIHKT